MSKRSRSRPSSAPAPTPTPEPTPSSASEAQERSSPSPGIRRQETAEQPRTESQKLADVSALLRDGIGESTDEGGESHTPSGQPPESSADDGGAGLLSSDPNLASDAPVITDWSVSGLADALGTDAETIYNSLKFNLGDEKSLTLGQMKDQASEMQEALRESVQREASLNERESVLNREQSMFSDVVNELRDHLSPEMVQSLQTRQQQNEARERHKMLQAIPEFKDATAFNQFRDDTVEFMSAYGFKPHELDIRDHRMILAIRDAMRMQKLIKRVGSLEEERTRPAEQKAHKPSGRRKPAGSRDKALMRARSTAATEADKVQGVAALLRGK